MPDLSKASWDKRVIALNRTNKSVLISMYRAGITRPDGQVVSYGWSVHPLEKWRKDEVIGAILHIEYPDGPK